MRFGERKQRWGRREAEQGSALFITLCLTGILGVTLASYLEWTRFQNTMAAESEAWNAALAIAEAGIEEGMGQINCTFGTNYLPSLQTNWPSTTPGVYGPRTSTLTNGSYSVIIIPALPGPTIIATGYTTVPFVGRPIQRTVRVTTTAAPAFGNAMSAIQNITFNGNNIAIDSFDSADPLHSTNGMYDRARRKAGGDVATTYGVIDVGNANINGKLRTGPDSGGFTVGANGFAGDLPWTGPGVQPGWYSDDFNMDFPDVTTPDASGWFTPLSAGTNKYVLGAGDYVINGDLALNAGESMLVSGPARLYVSGNVVMKGLGTKSSMITILTGASLKIYVSGASSTFTTVNTESPANASTFQYYGLPSNTALNWGGNAAYIGTVYAPQAAFTLVGSGDPKTPTDYQGACVVKSVSMNGHFNFHYDENLLRAGPFGWFVVTAWIEL